MTIQSLTSPTATSTSEAARDQWTAALDPHPAAHDPHAAPPRDVFGLLDYRTRCRALPRELAPPGRYLVLEQEGIERLIPLDRPIAHVGRGLNADIRLEDARVSRRHAIVAQRGDGARVLDTRSSNGTFVNDRPVTVSYLDDGDVVRFGPVALRFAEIGPVRRDSVIRRIKLPVPLKALSLSLKT